MRPLIVSNVESCRCEAGLFAGRPAPRVRLLRLFRLGHVRDAGLRCGSGRSRYVARHGAASPPADDRSGPVHLFPDMDAGRQRHHLRRCRRADSLSSLWRVTIDGNRAPERIEDAGEAATAPALARSRDRLAFTRMSLDSDIYRFQAGGPVQLVAGSSFMDEDARLSPDGRRLAFASRARAARQVISGLPRLTDRIRSNSPMVLETVRARRPGHPTGGALPLTPRGGLP